MLPWSISQATTPQKEEPSMTNVSGCIRARSTPGVLAALTFCGLALTPVGGRAVADDPPFVKLTGIARDFWADHPDFNVTPSAGYGHYAGNIALDLGADGRPIFVGGGYKVMAPWMDSASRPIAPHLYAAAASGTIPVAVATSGPSLGTLDTWDSSVGPYGGSNVGAAAIFDVGAPIPSVSVPTAVSTLPNQGNVSYIGATTISNDIHCDRLALSGTIEISGQVVILCQDSLSLSTHTEIILQPGASLRLYLKNGATAWNHTALNVNTGDPHRLIIYNLGTDELMIHNHAKVYAQIVSPNAPLKITNHGSLYGTFAGQTIVFGTYGSFHVDVAPAHDACGIEIDDSPGSAGVTSSGGISSSGSFDQWFRDVLGTNLSGRQAIRLVRNAEGVFELLENAFYPIDGMLLGNQGNDHNRYFTYAITFEFAYQACAGQFFDFSGADDAWLFVDRKLAMDLGGVVPGTEQYVQMDRLHLENGQTYVLHFFYAHRQAGPAMFHLRTNIIPEPTAGPLAAITAPFD